MCCNKGHGRLFLVDSHEKLMRCVVIYTAPLVMIHVRLYMSPYYHFNGSPYTVMITITGHDVSLVDDLDKSLFKLAIILQMSELN